MLAAIMSTHSSPAGTPTARSWLAEAGVIALGGSIGAMLRHGVGLLLAASGHPSVVSTAAVNLVGSFALGAVLGRLESPEAHPLLHPFWVIGVLGSFTTFSTLAFDNRGIAASQGEPLAALHIAASIAFGLLAFVAGTRLTGPSQ